MEFRVLGCHGGETPKHRPPAFLIDGRAVIDAGSLTSVLTLEEQRKIEFILISHAHVDHVRDLALMADTRAQMGGPPLTVASTKGTISALKRHMFNQKLWPDFTSIPSVQNPTVILMPLRPEISTRIGNFTVTPVQVNHTVEAVGFVVSDAKSAIAYSGDTGPTERLWQIVEQREDIRALVMEVAFPNQRLKLALQSGHHTPKLLEKGLGLLRTKRDLPVLLFHIKPVFQKEVERDLARIKGRNLTLLQLNDQFLL
ncbi:MAG: 3',5'-cyclic-nucleotide phosphodiesterase [Deltaproteobacteria bacterium]|nr:3',5'-cyclic-nucleotide phosphodiesterase [Deltaproteobacteria bacterium]